MGELELAWRLLPNRFVAVTGTNGKTTTVELLGAIYRAAGLPVAVAGNVGTPLSVAGGRRSIPTRRWSARRPASSSRTPSAFAPDTALLLNMAEDHLDRHGTFEAYRDASCACSPTSRGRPGGPARRLAGAPAARATVASAAPDADLRRADGELPWQGEPLIAATRSRLRGAHNLENAMAAAAAALARGVDPEAVREALRSFAGVPHRLEEVARASTACCT